MTDLQERIARHVYRAMRWSRTDDTPPWVDRGNSHAQQEARAVAQSILNDIEAQEKTDDQST